jgi:hypothetical protein
MNPMGMDLYIVGRSEHLTIPYNENSVVRKLGLGDDCFFPYLSDDSVIQGEDLRLLRNEIAEAHTSLTPDEYSISQQMLLLRFLDLAIAGGHPVKIVT